MPDEYILYSFYLYVLCVILWFLDINKFSNALNVHLYD